MATKKDNLPLTMEEDMEQSSSITYANEVVSIIAGVAAGEVEGIAGMCNTSGSILSKNRNITKGVKVEIGTEEASVDLYVVIEYGTPIQKAAQDAQAEFIREKEGGMNAEVVVRGNNLSGGQKQRLLIGRALAGDPEILILDDSSSALDYQTDANLRRALRENYRNTTTVLVTQRVSSLQHADLILVMADGEVIGAGDHQLLMDTCEEYRLIARNQMGLEREGV